MTSWLLIAGDFVPLGGMDRANHALALHLAGREAATRAVHVVAHRVWPDLERSASVTLHRVRRPLGSHLLGAPLLAAEGERRARGFRGRVIANGGNADAGDATWVHYVHAAHAPDGSSVRGRLAHQYYVTRERRALRRARIVVCNSRRTADDVRDRIGVPAERTRVIYYGSDPVTFSAVTADGRRAARTALGWSLDRPVVPSSVRLAIAGRGSTACSMPGGSCAATHRGMPTWRSPDTDASSQDGNGARAMRDWDRASVFSDFARMWSA
jgi:hypothetical protein